MRVVFQNHIAITFIKQFVKTRIEELTFLFDNSVVWNKKFTSAVLHNGRGNRNLIESGYALT